MVKRKCDNAFGIPASVQFITQEEIDKASDCNVMPPNAKPGWYFWDESGGAVGPYQTHELAHAAYGGYGDWLDNQVSPPEVEANIMVVVKNLKEPYAALYLPEDMGGMIHIHGLGDDSNRPWSDVVRWWPHPETQDLDFITAKPYIESFLKDLYQGKVTCINCGKNKTCPYRWDFYNTNGDCLADK